MLCIKKSNNAEYWQNKLFGLDWKSWFKNTKNLFFIWSCPNVQETYKNGAKMSQNCPKRPFIPQYLTLKKVFVLYVKWISCLIQSNLCTEYWNKCQIFQNYFFNWIIFLSLRCTFSWRVQDNQDSVIILPEENCSHVGGCVHCNVVGTQFESGLNPTKHDVIGNLTGIATGQNVVFCLFV